MRFKILNIYMYFHHCVACEMANGNIKRNNICFRMLLRCHCVQQKKTSNDDDVPRSISLNSINAQAIKKIQILKFSKFQNIVYYVIFRALFFTFSQSFYRNT